MEIEVKERCVRCGKETEYLISTPVMLRKYFIVGSGQLCPDCWNKLWPTATTKDKEE